MDYSLDDLGVGAPRLLLPHCSALDFVDAMPWEGVSRPSKPMHWLEPVLEKLPLKSFLNVALRDRASEDDCSVRDDFGTFQDPSCGLARLRAWETLTLFRDTANCVGQSSCLSGGTFRPRRQSVQGIRELSAEEVESMVLDRSVDVLTLSPSAGNCAELQRFLATLLQTALPQVLALPINALLAPPRRAAPDFLKAGKRLRETTAPRGDSFQLGQHCSLQSAIDFLPQFVLLFVDGLRAVFVSHAVRHHFGHVNAEARTLWRRGVSCTLPVVELLEARAPQGPVSAEAAALGSAAWPCEALRLPQLAKGVLPRVQNKELYPETEARCVSLAGPVESIRSAFLGATLPMTPGRAQLMSGRGRCFLEENFCECFPPWRDALCDRHEASGDGNEGSIIATRLLPGGEEELEQNLLNWWESFNNQMDHPVLIFHEGLETDAALRLRAASPTRVWFAHLGPLFSSQRMHGELDAALSCRFKFAWLLDEPSIQDFDWLLWIDSDVTFPIPLDRDLVRETSSAGASLGFLPLDEFPRTPRALRTLTLLFRQAERMRGRGEFSEDDWTDLNLSSRLLVMHLPSFRSPGSLKRFASWALEFSQQVPICRWGDAALRSMQAWLLPPEKRLPLQKLQFLRPNT
eukprot:s3006_g2.t1